MAGRSEVEHICDLMDGRVGGGEYQFRPLHPDKADIAAYRNPHFLLEFPGEIVFGVSDGVANIIQFHICSLQKLLCPVQLKIPKNFGEGLLKVIPK